MLFSYQDARGQISRRDLPNFKEDEIYIRGYCIYAEGYRVFRKDRILKEFTHDGDMSEFMSIPKPSELPPLPSCQRENSSALEVCFTGFAAGQRKELEDFARENRLFVRQSVTKNLTFLCTGHNAGPKKMKKAEDQGVCLMTEDELRRMVEDGVMPEGWSASHKEDKEFPVNWLEIAYPEQWFVNWFFIIKKAHWPALGIIQREFVDSERTEVLRAKWEADNPRYKELAPFFFREKKTKIKDHPNLPEWTELQEQRSKQKVATLNYAESLPRQYDFHEGDVFWSRDDTECLKVIADGESLEVMHRLNGKSFGYHISQKALASWLETGTVPSDKYRIQKNQSRNKIAQFYEYSEGRALDKLKELPVDELADDLVVHFDRL